MGRGEVGRGVTGRGRGAGEIGGGSEEEEEVKEQPLVQRRQLDRNLGSIPHVA